MRTTSFALPGLSSLFALSQGLTPLAITFRPSGAILIQSVHHYSRLRLRKCALHDRNNLRMKVAEENQ